MPKTSHPPRKALNLLLGCMNLEERENFAEYVDSVYGELLASKGQRSARIWFWSQFIRSFPGLIVKSIEGDIVMLRNYLKIAIRNFTKHKSFSFINISGLAIGMACCMLILLWVQDELNYERFNENIDEIYCIVNFNANNPNNYGSSVPAPLVPYLKDKYTEIKHTARFRSSGRRLFSYDGNNVFEDNGGFADPELFDIFSFEAVLNDPKAALTDFNTIILTKSMAERYFGSEDPLGKTIRLENQYVFSVGAIIEDIPKNSSIQFDYLLKFENLAGSTR